MHEFVTAVRLCHKVCMSASRDFHVGKNDIIMGFFNMSILPSCIMFLEIKDVFQ